MFLITVGCILLVFAIFGSSRPLWPFVAAGAFFAFCLGFAPRSTDSIGAAVVLVGAVLGGTLLIFIGGLIASFILKKKPKKIPKAPRIAITCFALLAILIGLANDVFRKETGELGMNLAITLNSPSALVYWRDFDDLTPSSDEYNRILNSHGLSEKSLKLLAAIAPLHGDIWHVVMAFSPSPERLNFLRLITEMEPDDVGSEFFIQAMDSGDIETADLLYPFISDPATDMVWAGRPDLLQDVLGRGLPACPKSYRGYQSSRLGPLGAAALEGAEYTRILLEAGFNPNIDGNCSSTRHGTPPLVLAAFDNGKNREAAQLLLAAGANPNSVDPDNMSSPLFHAAGWGSDALVEQLLEAGANPNRIIEKGVTPLHYAAIFGSNQAVRLLLEHGADPNGRDVYGLMPLHWAAWRGSAEKCALLLAAGAPPDLPDNEGFTPLLLAADQGHAPALAAILKTASPELKAMAGKADNAVGIPWITAVHIADQPFKPSEGYGYFQDMAKMGLTRKMLGLPNEGEKPGPGVWLRSLEDRAEAVRILLRAGADPMRVLEYDYTIFQLLFSETLAKDFGGFTENGYNVNLHKTQWNWDKDEALADFGLADMPITYPASLKLLLQTGIPMPSLIARGEATIEEYCNRVHAPKYPNAVADCVAALEEEMLRRESE